MISQGTLWSRFQNRMNTKKYYSKGNYHPAIENELRDIENRRGKLHKS
jgi:hypothetical protein